MSRTTVTPSLPRAHSVPVPSLQRVHRQRVARWALASGRPANRDALAAIVAARAASMSDPEAIESATVWTAAGIGSMLWTDVADWCDAVAAEVPAACHVTDTLDTYLRHLSAGRLIAPGSDPVAALRRAIVDYGGRRSGRHPSQRPRALAPIVPIA